MAKDRYRKELEPLNIAETNRLNEYCQQQGISRAVLLLKLLREFLESHG